VGYFGWMHPAAKARRMIVETLLSVPIVECVETTQIYPQGVHLFVTRS